MFVRAGPGSDVVRPVQVLAAVFCDLNLFSHHTSHHCSFVHPANILGAHICKPCAGRCGRQADIYPGLSLGGELAFLQTGRAPVAWLLQGTCHSQTFSLPDAPLSELMWGWHRDLAKATWLASSRTRISFRPGGHQCRAQTHHLLLARTVLSFVQHL